MAEKPKEEQASATQSLLVPHEKPWTFSPATSLPILQPSSSSSPSNISNSLGYLMDDAAAILADTNPSTTLASKISFLRDRKQLTDSQILEALTKLDNNSASPSSFSNSNLASPSFNHDNYQYTPPTQQSASNTSPYRQGWLYSDELMPPRWASWTSLLITGATLFHGWQTRDQWIPKVLQTYHDARNTILELFGFHTLREEEAVLEEELVKVHISLRDQVKVLRQEIAELKAQVNMLLVRNFEQAIGPIKQHEKPINGFANSPPVWATPNTTNSDSSSGLAFYKSMKEEAERALRHEYSGSTLPSIPDDHSSNHEDDNLFSYYGGTYDHDDNQRETHDNSQEEHHLSIKLNPELPDHHKQQQALDKREQECY